MHSWRSSSVISEKQSWRMNDRSMHESRRMSLWCVRRTRMNDRLINEWFSRTMSLWCVIRTRVRDRSMNKTWWCHYGAQDDPGCIIYRWMKDFVAIRKMKDDNRCIIWDIKTPILSGVIWRGMIQATIVLSNVYSTLLFKIICQLQIVNPLLRRVMKEREKWALVFYSRNFLIASMNDSAFVSFGLSWRKFAAKWKSMADPNRSEPTFPSTAHAPMHPPYIAPVTDGKNASLPAK